MKEVSVRELKNKLSECLRRVEDGEEITVTRRGKQVVRLSAIKRNDEDADLWKMVEEGVASWSGEKFVPPARGVPMIGEGPTVSEMLIEDRR